MRASGSIVFICAASYIGIAVFLAVFQSHYVYFPEREIIATPRDGGMAFDEVSFQSSDGLRISAWYIPAKNSRGVLLFCHGNGGNISHRLESIRIFNRLGLNVLIFDYRGYGQSEGSPTEEGTYRDAESAYQYLSRVRKINPSRIIIFGRSLGGAVAARIAGKQNPGALIIESAFTSIPDAASDLYPWLPVKIMARIHYATVNDIGQARCPVLIVHSRDDEMISIRHGRRIFEAAKEPKAFLEITGSHNNGFADSGKRYEEGLNAFISLYAPK
jgi:uncharacterized protein